MSDPSNTHEMEQSTDSRLTKVETEVESLSVSIKETNEKINKTNDKIDILISAVGQAQAPKKTDWHLLISLCSFIVMIGALVFIPINMQVQDEKSETSRLHNSLVEHQKLELHPVGASKIKALEDMLVRLATDNREAIVSLDTKTQKANAADNEALRDRIVAFNKTMDDMDTRLQREFGQVTNAMKDNTTVMQQQIDRRFSRVELLEDESIKRDLQELQQRRLNDDLELRSLGKTENKQTKP